jgi:hypothetical protein
MTSSYQYLYESPTNESNYIWCNPEETFAPVTFNSPTLEVGESLKIELFAFLPSSFSRNISFSWGGVSIWNNTSLGSVNSTVRITVIVCRTAEDTFSMVGSYSTSGAFVAWVARLNQTYPVGTPVITASVTSGAYIGLALMKVFK